MKKQLAWIFLVICLLSCVGCHHIDENHMEIYTGDKEELLLSTKETDLQIQFLTLVNEHALFDEAVDKGTPDYIVSLGPVDAENNTGDYCIWLEDDQIFFEMPDVSNTSVVFGISKHKAEEFMAILES